MDSAREISGWSTIEEATMALGANMHDLPL